MKIVENLKRRSIEKGDALFKCLLEHNPSAKLLDVGCGDGRRTMRFAERIGTDDIVGIDAKNFGVSFGFVRGNINEGLPFEDGTFDVVISRYVVEHVSSTDLFVKEIYRVLKRGGYTVISAPNMASGRIILELLLNKQPKEAHISDFFFLKKGRDQELETQAGYLHKRLFVMEGLVGLLAHYGFTVECKKRMGYGALFFGEILRGVYAANLLVRARK